MTTLNLRHVGIVTSNLNRSIKFYRDILGFKIIKKMDETGSNLSKVMGLKNVKVTTVKMKPQQGDSMVELLYWNNPKSKKKINCSKLNYFGLTHYAMTVKNIDKLYNALKKKGVKFINEPLISEDKNVKLAFCKSPDGVFIEMVQMLKK